jgi:DNA-binding GntR family transcriptional regulator
MSGLLRESIHDALRAAILRCDLAPGEELREQDLAARHGVSRAPVREALLRLEQEQLVTVHQRQGYTVRPIELSDATDLFDLRLILEPACAAAAAKAGDAALRGLDAFRAPRPGHSFIEDNRAFHTAIGDASGNRRMAALVRELIEQSERIVRVSIANVPARDPAPLIAQHAAMIDAMQNGDGRLAARLARDHVAEARDRVLKALRRSAVIIGPSSKQPANGGKIRA